MVLGTSLPEFNPDKYPLFSLFIYGRHDSIKFGGKYFSEFGHTAPPEPGYLNAVDLKNPMPPPTGNGKPKWPDIIDGCADDLRDCRTRVDSIVLFSDLSPPEEAPANLLLTKKKSYNIS